MAEGNGGEVEWLDQLVSHIRAAHQRIVDVSGGMQGEHTAALYSACARPFQVAFGDFIYATPYEQAGALLHAIVSNHVFVDGNKRTATLSALYVLGAYGLLDSDDKPSTLQVRLLGDVALEVALNNLIVEEVIDWLRRIFEPFPES